VTTALLAVTILLGVVSAALLALSFRRQDPLAALAGMTAMIAAALPAATYASGSG
jgi:hypothetical protein